MLTADMLRRMYHELTKPTLLVIAHPDDKDDIPPVDRRTMVRFSDAVPRGKVITVDLTVTEQTLREAV